MDHDTSGHAAVMPGELADPPITARELEATGSGQAMGSHGGATSAGQLDVLASYEMGRCT